LVKTLVLCGEMDSDARRTDPGGRGRIAPQSKKDPLVLGQREARASMRSGLVAAVVLVGLAGGSVLVQAAPGPGNDLPNPYQAAIRNWGTLPDSRTWGSTAGVEIGPRNEIWAIDRCGVNTCDGSNLPPVH